VSHTKPVFIKCFGDSESLLVERTRSFLPKVSVKIPSVENFEKNWNVGRFRKEIRFWLAEILIGLKKNWVDLKLNLAERDWVERVRDWIRLVYFLLQMFRDRICPMLARRNPNIEDITRSGIRSFWPPHKCRKPNIIRSPYKCMKVPLCLSISISGFQAGQRTSQTTKIKTAKMVRWL